MPHIVTLDGLGYDNLAYGPLPPLQIVANDEIAIKTGKASVVAPRVHSVVVAPGDTSGDDILTDLWARRGEPIPVALLTPMVQASRDSAVRRIKTASSAGTPPATAARAGTGAARVGATSAALMGRAAQSHNLPFLPYLEQEQGFKITVQRQRSGVVTMWDYCFELPSKQANPMLARVEIQDVTGGPRAVLEPAVVFPPPQGNSLYAGLVTILFSASRFR